MRRMIYKFKYTHKWIRKLTALIMMLVIIISIVAVNTPYAFAADDDDDDDDTLPDVDPVIWNYPSQFDDWEPGGEAIIRPIELDALEWSYIIDHVGYEQAYTQARSIQYNGYATPNHVVFDTETNSIRFFGYGIPAYMDLAFTNDYPAGFESISFTMRPVVMNFHTFSETGMLFNGSFNGEYYTGYALILKCGNMEGMLRSGEATLSLVYIENERMNGDSYNPGTLASTRTMIGSPIMTGISNLTTPAFKIEVAQYETGHGFKMYLNGEMVADIPEPQSTANGFGFFTGYYRHNCSILTIVEYGDAEIVADATPEETYATVRFVDINTGDDIANPQTVAYPKSELGNPQNPIEKSYSSDKFMITPPAQIGEYTYITSDRQPLDPIIYKKDPARNEIVLFYDVRVGVTKNASVNGIEDNGTQYAPVPVNEGGVIDYSIELFNPGGERDIPFTEPIEFTDIWSGADYGIARAENGDIYVWGRNNYGQLGLGDASNRTSLTKNSTLSALDIVEVWCGGGSSYGYNIALTSDGDVYVWGCNRYGELGLGYVTNNTSVVPRYGIATPTQNPKLSGLDIMEVLCEGYGNYSNNFAFTANGDVYVWGRNNNSVLGLGTTAITSMPTLNEVLSELDIEDWQYKHDHVIATTTDGDVYVWGNNANGKLWTGNTTALTVPTLNEDLADLRFIPPVSSMWVGNSYTIARTTDGDIYVWGQNSYGQLGLGNTTNRLRPTRNATLSALDIVDVWCSDDGGYNIARSSTGNIYVWGYNRYGELGLGYVTASPYVVTTPTQNPTLSGLDIADIWCKGDSVGDAYNFARTVDGTVYAWGRNRYSQLGLGTTTVTSTPTQNTTLSGLNIADWQFGENHVIATTSTGDVYVWGRNNYGQLWTGNTTNITVPTLSEALSVNSNPIPAFTDIWVGDSYTIARGTDGDIYVWGLNTSGQLATGDIANKTTPTRNAALSALDIVNVWCAGTTTNYYNIALTSSGDVYVWGYNRYGELGLGYVTASPYVVTTPTLNPTLSGLDIADIWCNGGDTAGNAYNFARASDGAVYAWGRNNSGQLGLGNATVTSTPTKNMTLSGLDIVDWQFGTGHVIVTTSSGNIYTWGLNGNGQLWTGNTTNVTAPTLNAALSGGAYTDVWAGSNYTIARDSSGDIYVVGLNTSGQLGMGDTVNKTAPVKNDTLSALNIVDIWCGVSGYNFALDSSGDVYAWGYNRYGELGLGYATATTPFAVNIPTLNPILSGLDIIDWKLESNQVIVTISSGDVYGWGINTSGALGLGDATQKFTPVKNNILSGLNIANLQFGTNFGVVLDMNGDIYVWGANNTYQLGLNITANQTTPIKNYFVNGTVFGAGTITDVWAGNNYTIARDSSGDIYVVGLNTAGQLGVGDTVSKTVPVKNNALSALDIVDIWSGGSGYNFALDSSGDIYAWGYNRYGELGLGYATATTPFAVTAPTLNTTLSGLDIIDWKLESNHVIVTISSGDIYGWGLNGSGQLGLGNTTSQFTPVKNNVLSSLNAGGGIVDLRCGTNNFGVVLDTNGDIYVWGAGTNGQLGLNNTTNRTAPIKNYFINGFGLSLGITDIWAGNNYTIVRTGDGDIYVVGTNTNGQLGLGNTTNSMNPLKNDFLSSLDIVDIWCGGYGATTYNFALDSSGDVYAWGYNRYGELGLGTATTASPYAVTAPTLNATLSGLDIEEIWWGGEGENYNFARTTAGDIYGWGYNYQGVLGLGTTTTVVPRPTLNTTLGDIGIAGMQGGIYYNVAFSLDGEVYFWGQNNAGQLGLNSTVAQNVPTKHFVLSGSAIMTDILCGTSFTISRSTDGDIYVVGANNYGQLGLGDNTNRTRSVKNNTLSALDIVDIWGGDGFVIARTEIGDVYVWGRNDYGQLGLPGDLANKNMPIKNNVLSGIDILNVWCGANHTIIRDTNGDFWVLGLNNTGQLGLGNTTSPIDTPTKNNNLSTPLLEIVDVICGANHNIAFDSDGNVYVWGFNSTGQLGLGDAVNKTLPTLNPGLTGLSIVDLQCGDNHSVAVTSDGEVYVWGSNSNGQLGLGNTTNQTTPVKNDGLSSYYISNVWCGGNYTIAKSATGDIYVCGQNNNGQLGLNSTAQTTSPVKNTVLSDLGIVNVQCGTNHNIANTLGGEIYVWGANANGQLLLAGARLGNILTPTYSDGLHLVPESFSVIDLLPAGLQFVTSAGEVVYSITDGDDNPVALKGLYVSVEVIGGREQITFAFTSLPSGIIRFNFSALVTESGYFKNVGEFIDGPKGKKLITDPTYHCAELFTITEHYVIWGGSNPADKLKDDTNRVVGPHLDEKSYSPYATTMRPITDTNGDVWRYYAYQRIGVDPSPVIGVPPDGRDEDHEGDDPQYYWCWKDVDDDHNIIFYFVKDVEVIIDYKDNSNRTGANLKLRYSEYADGLTNYYLSVTHMDAMGTWNYAGYYSLDGGATVLEGNPPRPAYEAAEMTGDKHIILYFAQNTVTVQYREYRSEVQDRQSSQLLFNIIGTEKVNKETFVVEIGDDFDPMARVTVANAISTGVQNFSGMNEYKIYKGWSDDGGLTIHLDEQPPMFEDIDGSKEIILYFSTTYIITEKFHKYEEDPHDTAYEIIPNIFTTVLGGDTFVGDPPMEILDGSWKWTYVGYRIGDFGDAQLLEINGEPNPEYVDPTIPLISGNETIVYLYEKEGIDFRVSIIERFREKDNTGHILQDNVTYSDLLRDSAFSGNYSISITPADEETRYIYWGYQIDGEAPVQGPFTGITLDRPYTITYLYEAQTKSDYVLHIRQIVIDPNSEVPLPDMGYFTMTGDDTTLSLTGDSGVDGLYVTDFTTYKIPVEDMSYVIKDIVPQNYEYLGYVVTESDGLDHDSADMITGTITVVYDSTTNEYYITIYITPRNPGGDHDESRITNSVGKVMSIG